jgi:hypothetical protein
VVVAAFLGWSASSHAAEGAPGAAPVARLTFLVGSGPSDCPDEPAFRALVTARLGRDPFDERATHHVNVRLSSEGRALVGRVELTGAAPPSVERTVRGSATECEAVVEALASVVAIQLGPDARTSGPPSEAADADARPLTPEPEEAPQKIPEPPRDEAAPPSPVREPAARPHFVARAALVSSVGLLPGTSAGGELGAGFGIKRFSLAAIGRAETQPGYADGVRGERLDASVLSAGLLPCVSITWVVGCGVGLLGVLQGSAPDAENPSLGTSFVGYVGGRLGASIRLGRGLALAPQVEAMIPVVRTTFVFAQATTWVAPPLLGSIGVALTYSAGP